MFLSSSPSLHYSNSWLEENKIMGIEHLVYLSRMRIYTLLAPIVNEGSLMPNVAASECSDRQHVCSNLTNDITLN